MASSVSPALLDTPALLQQPGPVSSSSLKRLDISELMPVDPSISACQDFYQHACGIWMKANPIPPEYSAWYRGFHGLEEQISQTLRTFLESYSENPSPERPHEKILGDFYSSCMNEDQIQQVGVTPLQEALCAIDQVKDSTSLAHVLAMLHRKGAYALFKIDVTQDFRDATELIGLIQQGGLTLPDRKYYLEPQEQGPDKQIEQAYRMHLARMFVLSGISSKGDAEQSVESVLAIERKLAGASLPRTQLRDPALNYHRMHLAELKRLAPHLDWETYFHDLGVFPSVPFNVAQPEFIKAVNQLVASYNPRDSSLRRYLRWHLLHSMTHALPKSFEEEEFSFFQRFTGAKKLHPRWKRCVIATHSVLGEALSIPFVQKSLGEQGKVEAQHLIEQIELQMRRFLTQSTWMDESTRKNAFEKLELMHNKVGYPGKWRSYERLRLQRDSFAENVAASRAFNLDYELAKIGKPLDREEWKMSPSTVNAYYEPSLNEMVFPAGMLLPPFFYRPFSITMNYGGIGFVMGHELTHGFDDEGKQFDGRGNLINWWSSSAEAVFHQKAKCIEDQYNEYRVVGDVRINGKLTLGENIADLGGIRLAYAAFKGLQAMTVGADTGSFSEEQRFFVAFAQSWCANVREEEARMRVVVDPHSPPHFRVNGPLSNMPEFARAFGCKSGDGMVRPQEKRCEVW
ncbi:hypothetical protein BCY86_00575 [Pajaroellobacter abortibovis]|uniref:Metallopeptidase n=2 Tax=Pajaroellobacter abortibovis TaxID=1882918 RepID=A0A1L6MZ16_9BACT|nr:hypothetical protein BCY86_00575 [Pajaroellobacter abortibovis]